MIAEIIPYTRTIRGVDFFDYDIPFEMSIQVGDVVRIPFRKSGCIGLIWNIKEHSAVARRRSIIERLDYMEWRSPERRLFCKWFAEYYHISLPHAWKTMQYSLPKRQKNIGRAFLMSPDTVKAGRRGESILIANRRSAILEWYRTYAAKISGNLLYIVPEYHDVTDIEQLFPQDRVIAFHREPTSTALITLERALHESSERIIVIGTKKCVFLPWATFDTILLDQEESRSHKQYHLNPRYHVRTVLEKIQEYDRHHTPRIIYSSLAPSMEVARSLFEQSRELIDIRTPWNDSHIRCIDMEQEYRNKNYSWFSEPLLQAIQEQKRTFLFLNRTGSSGAALCADCQALLSSNSARCDQCGSLKIRYVRKGTERLEQELRTSAPHLRIVRIDRNQELTREEIESADVVIGTEKIFRVVPMEIFDCIGILSVDHLLVYPHFASHERVFQLLTTLFSAGISTIIQTHAPYHPVIQAAMKNTYESFAQSELALRQDLHLPPYGSALTVLNSRTKKSRRIASSEELTTVQTDELIDRWE